MFHDINNFPIGKKYVHLNIRKRWDDYIYDINSRDGLRQRKFIMSPVTCTGIATQIYLNKAMLILHQSVLLSQ